MTRKSFLLLSALGALASTVGIAARADMLNPQPLPPHEDCVQCQKLVSSPVAGTHAPQERPRQRPRPGAAR